MLFCPKQNIASFATDEFHDRAMSGRRSMMEEEDVHHNSNRSCDNITTTTMTTTRETVVAAAAARSCIRTEDVRFQKELRLFSLEIPEVNATRYRKMMRPNPNLTRSRATKYWLQRKQGRLRELARWSSIFPERPYT
jgi:hypothetical protein